MHAADRHTIAETTAKILLELQAVHFNATEPFKLTSGAFSPVYIDCRKLISYPRARRKLMEMAEALILDEIGFEQLDSIAGGETAGIPFSAWIADRLDLPMQYVRKKPKGFGRDAQIEGNLEPGSRVLLVEDLTTDGGSKINFCQALRTAGAEVKHVFVLFHYGIFEKSLTTLADIGVSLHALATWHDVLAVARTLSYFEKSTLDEVESYLQDPIGWSARNGRDTSADTAES